MKLVACLAVLATGLGVFPAPAPGSASLAPPTFSRDDVRVALGRVDEHLEQFVARWIRIAEIPAPSGSEEARARYLAAEMSRIGLDDVSRDDAGNVIGRLAGADAFARPLALLAHMDTVAPADADHTVQRTKDGRLIGPGIRDDSSGLAALLAVAELLKRTGLRPAADTWFVATVREEIGLQGAEAFVGAHEGRLGAVIAIDGYLGQVSYAATGIVWLRLHFLADGAHTLRSYDTPSATLAAARTIERLSAIPLRRSPESMESWLNIGMVGGGEVPNAQARDVWLTVDLRSNDPATWREMEQQVLGIGRQTAREVGTRFEHETLHRLAGASIAGFDRSRLVETARRALEHLGWGGIYVTPRGTADHNVAIVRGIPAIAVGVTTGEGAHTPEEYADIAPFATGVKQLLLLAVAGITAPAAGIEDTAQ